MSKNLEFESLLYDLYGGGTRDTKKRLTLAAHYFPRSARYPYGEQKLRG